jgi:hypothetical protein
MGFIIGVVVGAVFSPILIQLFKIGYSKIKKNVDRLED